MQAEHLIEVLKVDPEGRALEQLCDVLIDCVEGGASVSFMSPFNRDRAEQFWRNALAAHERGDRVILVSRADSGVIVGTVQVVMDLPENQPHRVDIAKMLVHRRARQRGLGMALMLAAEAEAKRMGKTLMVLDTVTGGDGERLYARAGWTMVGSIPNYALFPNGEYCATTVFYKEI